MKDINLYIIEKLHLNKDIETEENPDPFDKSFNEPEDLLNWIVETFEQGGCGGNYIWDDTERYEAANDFGNFDTTYGASIDWLDEFKKETDGNMVAIWQIKKNIQANIEGHPFTKFFQAEFETETLYKKEGYYVKYWGDYEYDKGIYVSMVIATPGETDDRIIAFIIKRNT
ncbi:MAG: hypothetical protein IJH39_11785 [Clostridia bacterium]|nr:hypothetical protein [Clostridia bacterium]